MTWRLSGFSSAAHAASQVRAAAAARVPPAASSADTPIPVCIYCSAFAPLYFSLTTLDCPAPLRCYRGLLYSFTLQRLSTGAAQTNPCSMFVLCTAILLWNKTKLVWHFKQRPAATAQQGLHNVLVQNCKRGSGGTCRIPLSIPLGCAHRLGDLPLAQSPSRLKSLSVRSTTTS